MKEGCNKSGETAEQRPVSCRCGRAPRRKGQRNCRLCHAEANRRYRASVKKQNEALKKLAAKAKP